MTTIYSQLYKAAMLGTESSFFPRMVEAAAWGVGKPYSAEMLHYCSTNYAILQKLTLEVEGGMDAVISAQVATVSGAGQLDAAINGAVLKFKPPVPTG